MNRRAAEISGMTFHGIDSRLQVLLREIEKKARHTLFIYYTAKCVSYTRHMSDYSVIIG